MAKAIIWNKGSGSGVIIASTDEITSDIDDSGTRDLDDQDESCTEKVKQLPEGLIFYEGDIEFKDELAPIWLGKMRRATAADLKEMGLID